MVTKIKVIKAIPDKHGGTIPDSMIGGIYDVIRDSSDGYWVKYDDTSYRVIHGEYEVVMEENMKTLSTWEILKNGKVGERFETEPNHVGYKAVIEINECGSIVYAEGHGLESAIGQPIVINAGTREVKWKLVPKYITFNEARVLLLNDKKVKVHLTNGDSFDVLPSDKLSVKAFLTAKFSLTE
jgi:hypothetical protein